jgi:sugar lactone lactonase YvrE
MARKKLIIRSYRTMVGVLGPETRFGNGVYIYDSNDTQKNFAFFAFFTGVSDSAERFSLEFLADRASPYLDSTRTKDITKPAAFVKGLISELNSELESAGFIEHGSTRHCFAVALVMGSMLHVGRINTCPIFYMKDRKFRQIFRTPKSRGPESIQVESVSIDNTDHLIVCSEDLIKHMTKLEIRNVLLTDDELNLACSKLLMLANRYEEVVSPRLMIVKFRKNEEKLTTFFTKRNVGVIAALALFIMILFMWSDIVRALKQTQAGLISRKGIVNRMTQMVQPDVKTYVPELVMDNLSVPYDAAVDERGVVYAVDDRETKVIKYDPGTGKRELIGDKLNLSFPTGIDIADNRVYVADFSRQVNRVFIITADGAYIGKAPDEVSENLSMKNPKSVSVLSDAIYVCDRGNNRILIFDPDGALRKKIDVPSNTYLEPNGLAATDNGNLFVTLKMSGTIAKISGNSISSFTLYIEKDGGTKKITMDKPSGIAVDPQGFIYVTDTGNRRILVSNPMGRIVGDIDEENFKEFENFYPMNVKLDKSKQYLYIIGSNHYSYDPSCEKECRGKIWRVKI